MILWQPDPKAIQRKAARVARERELRRKARDGEMKRAWQLRVPTILAILGNASGPVTALEISTALGIHAKAISLPLAQMRIAGQVRKIPGTARSPVMWALTESAVVSEARDGIALEWHRRVTAGGTVRLELVSHREGQPLPRWSKAIGPTEPREPVVEAALKFWRAA